MSIILKGIDLPEGETIVIHYANKYGEMETVYVDESDIIQIPKEHGRLIEERYPGELKAKHPEGLFIIYHAADEDPGRFIFEVEAES